VTTLPAVVTRLLDDLGQRELAGDLAEELHAGRSTLWVWWQTSAAVLRGVGAVARTDPYRTFRAIALGWIVTQLLNGRLPFSAHLEIGAWIRNAPVSGILIAAQYFAAGWVVARLHQQHRTALVLATGLFLMLTNTLWWAYVALLVSQMQPTLRLFPSGLPLLLWCISTAWMLLLPAMTIAGGLWGRGWWSPATTVTPE
jgi:hypothetical protein